MKANVGSDYQKRTFGPSIGYGMVKPKHGAIIGANRGQGFVAVPHHDSRGHEWSLLVKVADL